MEGLDTERVPFRHRDGSKLGDELEDLINRVIGAAIEVHRALGPGYLESVYENAMAIELQRRGIRFTRQVPFDVMYCGQSVGQGRMDLFVEDQLVVELKSVEAMNKLYTAQTISYLRAMKLKIALLINFNVPLLKDGIRRIIL